MLAGDICGPETNLRTGPRASTRNFTCAPPISMTRMWRARKLPGVLLLARIERILPGIGGSAAERHATAARLVTVNGSIHLKEAVRVGGSVQAVNGAVTVADGADVAGPLSNVNGAIRVAAAHIGGLIDTATGDIEIGPNAHVDGGIHVEKDTSWFHIWFWSEDTPRVVVGPGSVVGGTLKFERKVTLYVSDRATIGPVEGATAVRFSGDRPPG